MRRCAGGSPAPRTSPSNPDPQAPTTPHPATSGGGRRAANEAHLRSATDRSGPGVSSRRRGRLVAGSEPVGLRPRRPPRPVRPLARLPPPRPPDASPVGVASHPPRGLREGHAPLPPASRPPHTPPATVRRVAAMMRGVPVRPMHPGACGGASEATGKSHGAARGPSRTRPHLGEHTRGAGVPPVFRRGPMRPRRRREPVGGMERACDRHHHARAPPPPSGGPATPTADGSLGAEDRCGTAGCTSGRVLDGTGARPHHRGRRGAATGVPGAGRPNAHPSGPQDTTEMPRRTHGTRGTREREPGAEPAGARCLLRRRNPLS